MRTNDDDGREGGGEGGELRMNMEALDMIPWRVEAALKGKGRQSRRRRRRRRRRRAITENFDPRRHEPRISFHVPVEELHERIERLTLHG